MTYWEFFKTLFYDVFVASLGTYLAVLAAESVSKGIVVSILNASAILVICGISGMLAMFFPPKKHIGDSKAEYAFSVVCALLSGVITYQVLGGEKSGALLLSGAMAAIVLFFLLSARLCAHDDT
jgi:hypothetical protein